MTDDQSRLVPRASAVEALTQHKWATFKWGNGPGYNWRCSCGVNDRGTGASNPERFHRYPDQADATRAAAEHVAAVLALDEVVEILAPDADGLVHVEDGWRIRRTYTVGEPGEIVERLEAPR